MDSGTDVEGAGETIIFNLNRLPFHDFDSAAQMRDLLHKESGFHYRVEKWSEGLGDDGYVVIRNGDIDKQRSNDVSKLENNSVNAVSLDAGEYHVKVYHPALRTYLLHFPVIVLGILLYFFAVDTWSLLSSTFDLSLLAGWIEPKQLMSYTKSIGKWILLIDIGSILYSYYGVSLVVDRQGVVLKKGIVARDIINVRYSEIRTVGLKQGIIDRLLNIGIIELASSGSDGVDIRFFDLARPGKVKAMIEARIDDSGRRGAG